MTLKIIGWKIWYGDGTTFSSLQGIWKEAPDQNVQFWMIYLDKKDGQGRSYRQAFSGDDFYFTDGIIYDSSFDDESKVIGIVKYGKWMDDEGFEKIRLEAMEDYSI